MSICGLNLVCIATNSHETTSEIPQVPPGPNLFNGLYIRLLIFSNLVNCIGTARRRYDWLFLQNICGTDNKLFIVGIHFRVGSNVSPTTVHWFITDFIVEATCGLASSLQRARFSLAMLYVAFNFLFILVSGSDVSIDQR